MANPSQFKTKEKNENLSMFIALVLQFFLNYNIF